MISVLTPLCESTMPKATSSGPASSGPELPSSMTRLWEFPWTPQGCTWPQAQTAPSQARPAPGAWMPLCVSTMPKAPSSGSASSGHHPLTVLPEFPWMPQGCTWLGVHPAPCQARPGAARALSSVTTSLYASTMPKATSSGPGSSGPHPLTPLWEFPWTPRGCTWPEPQKAPSQARQKVAAGFFLY